MKLDGKTAIVTGSGQGIGRAIALALAKEGADVVINVRKSVQRAKAVADEVRALGRRALVMRADVSKKGEVDQMVKKTLEEFGKVDILVNNAGISARAPIEELSEEDWDRVMNVNLKGAFLCSVAAGKEMIKLKRGNIINIVAASGHRSYPLAGAFGPSKAAVISLTKQLAMEWAKYNIRVNGVSPGPIWSPQTESMLKDEKTRERIKKIPMGRIGRPEEIADVAVFLASEDSSYITGQVIIVDGGGSETWYLYP